MTQPNSNTTLTGLSYAQAMGKLSDGFRVRLPDWNDETWMEIRDGQQVMNLGGRVTSCQPRDSELQRWDWIARK